GRNPNLRLDWNVARIFGNPNRKRPAAAHQTLIAEHRRLNSQDIDTTHDCFHFLALHDRNREAIEMTSVDQRNVERLAGLKVTRPHKVDHGEDVLDRLSKRDSRRRWCLVISRIEIAANRPACFVIKGGFSE